MSPEADGRSGAGEIPMRLRYGVNEADSWWHFALGPQRERIWDRLRELEPRIIRIFLFDKSTPDPVTDWPSFRAYVQAVLNLGAIPMITFARSHRPIQDPRGARWFAQRCADVAWNSIEQWGGETVREWYWCVWNEPNNSWIGGGLRFEQYRQMYEEVAWGVLRWLEPWLHGQRARIGGPSVEGFDPFWMDWIWRFVHEVDPSLVGFVNWHRYADWREDGEDGAPGDGSVHRALILSQTPDYESRAQAVAHHLNGSGVLNICGEWNAHSHYLPRVRARFNQALFGAAYGVSALLHLMRGGADAEMLWTGTDDACGYGVLDKDAVPTPLFHAKKLCARYIRYGDQICFPEGERPLPPIQTVLARGQHGRRSALFVHLDDKEATYPVPELAEGLKDCRMLLKIDGETGDRVCRADCDGLLTFRGYGVAVITNREPHPDEAPPVTWS